MGIVSGYPDIFYKQTTQKDGSKSYAKSPSENFMYIDFGNLHAYGDQKDKEQNKLITYDEIDLVTSKG